MDFYQLMNVEITRIFAPQMNIQSVLTSPLK